MSVLNGYAKYKRYVKKDTGYQLCSHWTSSNTVHFDDGKTAQEKLGAISGITDSLTATSSNVALSSKAGNNLQSQINELNTGLKTISSNSGNFSATGVSGQYSYAIKAGVCYLNFTHVHFTTVNNIASVSASALPIPTSVIDIDFSLCADNANNDANHRVADGWLTTSRGCAFRSFDTSKNFKATLAYPIKQ